MTVLVLGWDGLDYQRAVDLGVADAFGQRHQQLDTITNDTLGTPHTYELWPTIVTGQPPEGHGIHAEAFLTGGAWSNPLLGWLARLSEHTVPDRLRWWVGRKLRSAGAGIDFHTLAYYRDRDIPTVFNGQDSLPLAIPNARSDADDALGIEMDRGARLADYLAVETGPEGETIHRPQIDPPMLRIRLAGDASEKLGLARAACGEYDLVFVWLGYLDTMGHVAPTVTKPDRWVGDAYRAAAQWTRECRRMLGDGDTLVTVSDHGLSAGAHTNRAFIGTDDGTPEPLPEHVSGVAPFLTGLVESTASRKRRHDPTSFDAVRERLDNLGYL